MKIKGIAPLSILLICIAISGIAFGTQTASEPANSKVTVTLSPVLTVSATDVELSGAVPGVTPATGHNQITVTSQNAGFSLAAYAPLLTYGTHTLGTALEVNTASTGTFTPLPAISPGYSLYIDKPITGSSGTPLDVYYQQAFAASDVAGIYTTTITWTATATWS
jgi:hypothetical protein